MKKVGLSRPLGSDLYWQYFIMVSSDFYALFGGTAVIPYYC